MAAKAFYLVGQNEAHLVEHCGFPPELVEHLNRDDVLALDGDTHLARFIRGEGAESGELQNTMPGSRFHHFEFAKATLLGTTVVVGKYE